VDKREREREKEREREREGGRERERERESGKEGSIIHDPRIAFTLFFKIANERHRDGKVNGAEFIAAKLPRVERGRGGSCKIVDD